MPISPPRWLRDAGQLVPEYEMKRHALEPQPGAYDFSGLDPLFGFAARNGLTMRGHPLVWYLRQSALAGSRRWRRGATKS